jgi:effector-binding domain-containing protein
MIEGLKLEDRKEQHYVGIRTMAALPELPTVIPDSTREVYGWLGRAGVPPAGMSFIRYHVINMETKLDITLGVPVAKALAGDDRIVSDVLPAGRYATLIYTGDYSGLMGANKVLIDWAQEQGLAWDNWPVENGDAFKSRYESYIRDPGNEPDPAKWVTEVSIKLKD